MAELVLPHVLSFASVVAGDKMQWMLSLLVTSCVDAVAAGDKLQ